MSRFRILCHKLLSAFVSLVIFVAPLAPIFQTTSVYAYDGCMDPGYLEYDSGADNDPGGYCITPVVMGCTNPLYVEYNPAANTDDGSCVTLIPTPPTLSTATVNATTLTLTYNEALDTGSIPATSDFVVNVSGSPVNISSVNVSGTTVVLTLEASVGDGTAVTLNYTPGGSPTQDLEGTDAGVLSGQSVTNNTPDATAPTLSTATVDGTTLTLTYNEALDTNSTPATSDFSATVSGAPIDVSLISIIGSTIVLTLSASAGQSPSVSVSYVPGASPIQDIAGNDVSSLGGQSVTNVNGDSTAPILNYAAVNATTLTLYYNELDSGSIPSASDFVVNVNGSPVTINSVSLGQNVVLTLNASVGFATTVTLNYIPGANPIQDAVGNDASSLSDRSVVNTTLSDCFAVQGVGGSTYSVLVGTNLYHANGKVTNTITDTVIADLGIASASASVVGNNIYLLRSGSNNVSVIDADPTSGTYNTAIATINVGTTPQYSAVFGTKVYVVNTVSNNVSVIDADPTSGTYNTVIATISVGTTPQYANTVGTRIYIVNRGSNNVSVIDADPTSGTYNTVIATVSGLGVQSYSGTLIGTNFYVPNSTSNNVSVIDADPTSGTYNTVIATISVGANPYYANAVVGSKLYIVNRDSHNVSVIDADPTSGTYNTVIATISAGINPISSVSSGTKVYVNNQGSDSVSIIDSSTDTIIATVPGGTSPSIFPPTVVGTKVYVNNSSSLVPVIDTTTNALFNTCAPHLTSITSATANGNYDSGESVSISANFNESLATGSKMRVTLNTGAIVDLTTISGTVLSGIYLIGVGEVSPDLSVSSISSNASYTSVSDTDGTPNTRTSYSIPYSPDLSTDTAQNLGDLKNISIGGAVCGIAVGTNPYQMITVGTLNYVANMGSDNVSVINTATNAVTATITVGDGPYGLAYNSTSKELYIANLGGNTVSVIDADPVSGTFNTVTNTISVGVEPYYVASLGTKIYVTNNISNSVSVINTATHTVTNTIIVGVAPRGIKAHGTDLYISNYGSPVYGASSSVGTVSVINSINNTVTDTITVGSGPRGVVVVGDEVYVANFLDDTVSVISTTTNTVTHTISVGNTPRGITALGTKVYVENYQDGTVSVINTATHAVTATISVGNTPAGFAANDTDLYISRFTDDVVSILDTTTNTMRTTCPSSDSTAPTFTMQIYSDSGLSTAVTDNAILPTGTYYVSVTADETLSAAPTISIAAQGTANDVTGATMTSVSGNQYKYTYVVVTDAAATGTVLADFSVTGTDSASNAATNVSPTNEATKAIYTDGILPTFSSANANGSALTMTYSEALNSSSTPATGSFTVLVNGVAYTVSSVTVSSTSVVLTLTTNILAGQTVTVAYTVPGSSMIEDSAGNDAAALSATLVTNTTSGGGGGGGGGGGSTFIIDITAPVLTSLTANGSILKLVYNEILDPLSIPQTGAYTVRVNGVIRPITSVSIAGLEVQLLMSSGVVSDDVITITYTVPFSQLGSDRPTQDVVGNDAISFISQTVANITTSHVPSQEIPGSPVSTNSGYGLTPVNNIKSSTFLYLLEDPILLTRLQKIHGKATITESIYHNQCETKQGKTYYRTCLFDNDLPTFERFLQNVICEGFVSQKLSSIDYRLEDAALRKEVTGVAVKMKKINGGNVALAQPDEYRNIYSDIGKNPNEAKWIQPIVETALKYGIVSETRKLFEPDRQVTRAEAYAMIMDSVCMLSHTPGSNWQRALYDRALGEKLTSRTWDKFEPNRPMLRQELFSLSSRVVEWAERTGGCNPKPEFCFLDEK